MLDSSAVAFQLILAVVKWGKRPEGLSQVCGRDGLADRRQSFEDGMKRPYLRSGGREQKAMAMDVVVQARKSKETEGRLVSRRSESTLRQAISRTSEALSRGDWRQRNR